MAEYKNVAVCDLRNISVESAKQIEGIVNVALVVMPKDASEELKAALAAIPQKNVATTVYMSKEGNMGLKNGLTIITDADFAPGQENYLICNGITVLQNISPETRGTLCCNGIVVFQKKLQQNCGITMGTLNGMRAYLDFEECHQFAGKVTVDKDMLDLLEAKTLAVAAKKIVIAPDVTMEQLKEKKPCFVAGEKIACSKETAAYVKVNSYVGEKIEVYSGEEWDDEDDGDWDD